MASESEEQTENVQNRSLTERIGWILQNITVEPILIFFLLPSVMTMLSIANLNLEKACRVKLRYNDTICDGLAIRNTSMYTEHDESAVQKAVAAMSAWKSVITSVVPSCLLLLFGSWSDRHNRRKPFLLMPIVGEILTTIGLLCCTYFFYELSMEVTGLIESIPTAFTGGWFTMFMAIFSYIAAISSVKTRTIRIGAVNIFNHGSLMIGIASSGILYHKIGLYGIFSITLSLYTIGFFYTLFRIKENPLPVEENAEAPQVDKPKIGFFKDFFNLKYVWDTMRVAFKPRPNGLRKRLCTIMFLVMIVVGPVHGEISVVYLFTRKQFHWNEVNFSLYYTYNVILHILGTVFSLAFFSKFLKLDDSLLGLISSTSKILSSFVYAFAPNSSIFCLGVLVEILNGTSFIALRSIISKLVPAEDLGKINSLYGVCEALMPLAYAPLYNIVYRATIDTLPGAFYLVGGALTLPALGIWFWLYLQHLKDVKEAASHQPQKEVLLTKLKE